MTRPAHLEPTESDRGFVRLPPIPGNYGGCAEVYESSSAEGPKLWLKVSEPNDLNAASMGDESAGVHFARLHLTAEDAWKLADQLRCAVENHYQGDARPSWAKAADTGPCTWCAEADSPTYRAHEGHDPECPMVVSST